MDSVTSAGPLLVPQRWGRLIRWLGSMLLGVAATISYAEHFMRGHVTRSLDWAVLLVYFVLLCAPLAYLVLFRVFFPRFRSLPRARRSAWLAGALLIGGVCAVVAQPATAASHQLTITATGQKNANAQASEVWLRGIDLADGSSIPFEQLQQQGQWQIRDTMLYSAQAQPATLVWLGDAAGIVRARFVAHPWSGIAQITWDGQVHQLDLYAPETSTKELALTTVAGAPQGRLSLARRGSVFIADLLSISIGLLAFGLLMRGRLALLRNQQDTRVFAVRRLLLLVGLVAVPLTLVLTPIFLADPASAQPMPRQYYAYVWLYSVGVLLVLVRLCVRGDTVLVRLPEDAPLGLHRSHRLLLGQPLLTWLAALIAIGILAGVLTHRFTASSQRAVWARVELDAAASAAPPTTLRYGNGSEDVALMSWQPYEKTDVAIRPTSTLTQPLQVLSLQTDLGVLPLSQVKLAAAELHENTIAIPQPVGALLTWPQASRAITLTFAPGSGSAEVLWYDQRAPVTLGAQPTSVALRLPAMFQGWALLPPEAIDQMTMELPAGQTSYRIRDVSILSTPPQTLSSVVGSSDWRADSCTLTASAHIVTIVTVAQTQCTLQLPHLEPINVVPRSRTISLWLAFTAGLLVLLWVTTFIIARAQRFAARYQPVETKLGRWVRTRSQSWRTWPIMLGVFGVALLYHLAYALMVRSTFTGDSVSYYDLGRSFVASPLFASMNSVRTPGYPLFIALIIWIFGDTTFWIVVAQHLALALLAPLAVWTLRRRVPPMVALVGGLSVAFLPSVSLMANIVWTESLFTTFMAAALLVFIAYGERLRGLLFTGMLVGVATMIRPTGLVLLVIIIGWVLVTGWYCIGAAARQRFSVIGSAALVAGYLAIAAPWHMHLFLVRDTLDLSQGHTNFTIWAVFINQGLIDDTLPINVPDHALWAAPYAWSKDSFALMDLTPQVLKGDTSDRQAYYAASNQQAMSINAPHWRENVVAALVYNVVFVAINPRVIYWGDVETYADFLETEQPTNLVNDPYSQLLEGLVDRWRPPQSPVRTELLQFTLFVVHHWAWVALPTLVLIFVLLSFAHLRMFVPAWFYWMAMVLSSTALGTPAERYVMVTEPAVYLLVVIGLYGLVCLRYKRRHSQPGV